MRGVQQAKTRANVLKNLDAITALWIRDFAQKYLPTKVTAFLTICFTSTKAFFVRLWKR